MPKARAGLRIKEALGAKSPTNRSQDLLQLTDQFNAFKAKVKNLVAVLGAQHASMIHMNKTRMEVARQVAAISERTPIFECTARLPADDDPKDNNVCSFLSVHSAMSSRLAMYADRYLKFVVNYAIEWERVIVNRVTASLKKAEILRRDLDHYQRKVESLRHSANVTMSKGKQVDSKSAEKLQRNEEKLLHSKREYEQYTSELCALIEEVTFRGWKDLHPVLIKMAQFDATLASDEQKLFANLNTVVDGLKRVADKHGLQPQARLNDLETLTPKMISTKTNDLEAQQQGTIMGGDGYDGALSPTSAENGALTTRAGSFASAASYSNGAPGPASTSEMLAVAAAAAPPPTIDMVNDATTSLSIGGPSNGHHSSFASLPPLAPNSLGVASRSSSFNDTALAVRTRAESDSSVSLGSLPTSPPPSTTSALPMAPPPAAAPPPPPPPPALSMYSSINMDVPVAASLDTAPAALPPSYGAPALGDAMTPSAAPAHPWSTGGSQIGAAGTNPFGAGPAPTPAALPPINTNPFDDGPGNGGMVPYGAGSHRMVVRQASSNPFDN